MVAWLTPRIVVGWSGRSAQDPGDAEPSIGKPAAPARWLLRRRGRTCKDHRPSAARLFRLGAPARPFASRSPPLAPRAAATLSGYSSCACGPARASTCWPTSSSSTTTLACAHRTPRRASACRDRRAGAGQPDVPARAAALRFVEFQQSSSFATKTAAIVRIVQRASRKSCAASARPSRTSAVRSIGSAARAHDRADCATDDALVRRARRPRRQPDNPRRRAATAPRRSADRLDRQMNDQCAPVAAKAAASPVGIFEARPGIRVSTTLWVAPAR